MIECINKVILLNIYLHTRTLKLGHEISLSREYSNVKTISMWVTDEDVASVTHVNAVWKICDILAANATNEFTIFVEHHNAVALEVAHVVLFAWKVIQYFGTLFCRRLILQSIQTTDGNVTGFSHVIAAIEPSQQIPVVIQDKYSRWNAVNSDNVTLGRDL